MPTLEHMFEAYKLDQPMRGGGGRFGEIGRTGLRHSAGFIDEEFVRELRGQNGSKTFREMVDNSAKLGAALFIIEQVIRQAEWRVEPWSQEGEDIERGEFLQSCLDDMSQSWPDTLTEILTMLWAGFAPLEIVYKQRQGGSQRDPARRSRFTDGRIGWRKLSLRSQDSVSRWAIDGDGSLLGLFQQAPPNWKEVFIPIEKLLLFRPKTTKANPEGRSILRSAYFDYYFAKRLTEVSAIGAERNVSGMPVVYVPARALSATATAEQAAMVTAMREMVENLRNDEQSGVVMPQAFDRETQQAMYKLELLASAGGQKAEDILKLIEHHERNMLMVAMADFMTIGHEGTGAFALVESKTDTFLTAVAGWLDSISEVVNRFGVPRLFALNGFPLDRLPMLEHGDLGSIDIDKVAAYIEKLSKAGLDVFPDEALARHLFALAKLPQTGREEMAEMDELDTRERIREREEAAADALAQARAAGDDENDDEEEVED